MNLSPVKWIRTALCFALATVLLWTSGCATAQGPEIVYPPGAPKIVSDYESMFTTYGKSRSEAGVNPVHDAIDIEGHIGETILAAADGVVFRSHWNNVGGNRIVIEHGQDADGNYLRTVYLHLTERSVEVGQKVKRGQLIGTLGVTGSGASGRVPHLHFSVYKGPTKEYSKQ